jgi:hypothetical protein
MISAPARR